MFSGYPDIMSVEQLAEALGIGKNSAYSLVNNGRIGCKRIGRRILIPKSCVIDFVQSARYTVTADESALSERRKNDR